MTVPRVLIASHTYTAPINRAQLDALARIIPLTAIAPRRWRDALLDVEADSFGTPAYTLHALPIRFDGHILRHFYPLRQLGRILRETRPDVVHVEEEPASLALAQFAWLKRRFAYRLTLFTWENIKRRDRVPGLAAFNLRHCDGAVAGSREAAEVVRRKSARGPIAIIPQLGIDPEQFQPAESPDRRQAAGTGRFVVGYVGRLVEEKGLRILLEAMRAVPNPQLLAVGDGPLREEVAAAPGARLIGAIPHEQVTDYLHTMDVLALPSLTTPAWKEQFGHVLIEAMACGVPVIGSDSGAIPEVVVEAGLIVPEGDAAGLREAILALQNDPGRRERLAQAGRQRVMAHYTHDRIAAAKADFFRQVWSA